MVDFLVAVSVSSPLLNRSVGVIYFNIFLDIRHENVKVHTAVLGLGLDVGAGRHDTVTTVDVSDPVADLLTLVEGLADDSLVVILPGRGGTARLVGPGRLGGDVLGVGLGGVEAPNPTDQGVTEQVAPVVGVVVAARQVMRLEESRGFPVGRPVPGGGPVPVLAGCLVQPGVATPGPPLIIQLVDRVGCAADIGIQVGLVMVDNVGPMTIPDNAVAQLLAHGRGQDHRRLLFGRWFLLLVAIVAGLRRIALAPGHETLNSLTQGGIALGRLLDHAAHDEQGHDPEDNVPNLFLDAVHKIVPL